MANNGGVIIYGIGEDENGRVSRLTPISLAGQAEKIDAIVRTVIAEPPVIHISAIPTKENSAIGYLIVNIPPSERAPHMVSVKGDHRFYGRTATGNFPLSEKETWRGYMPGGNSRKLTENSCLIQKSKLPHWSRMRTMLTCFCLRAIFAKADFFGSMLDNESNFKTILNELVQQVCTAMIYKHDFSHVLILPRLGGIEQKDFGVKWITHRLIHPKRQEIH